jgi:hypothetical protein
MKVNLAQLVTARDINKEKSVKLNFLRTFKGRIFKMNQNFNQYIIKYIITKLGNPFGQNDRRQDT